MVTSETVAWGLCMVRRGDDDRGELEALRAELDQLVYRISHDFRAPLRQSRQLAEWAREDWRTGETAEVESHLEMLDGRLAHMQRMLDVLLELSRLAGAEPASAPVALDDLLNDVVGGLEVPEHVTVTLPARSETTASSGRRLGRVVELLLENSLRHGGDDLTAIHISVVSESGLALEVRDDGVGYEPNARGRAFELFFTTRPGTDFVGAGLTLAQRIVSQAGAELLIGSPERGAVMRFAWPGLVASGETPS